jgi:hypothetical protein
MPISVGNIALQIQRRMPACKVTIQDTIDNILVENASGKLGFAITRQYIEDHSVDDVLMHAEKMATNL